MSLFRLNKTPIFFAKGTFHYIRTNHWSWKYLITPTIINLIIFFLVLFSLFNAINSLILGLSFFSLIPGIISTIVTWVVGLITLLASLLIFFLLANLIASPFNGLLAEKMLVKEGILKDKKESLIKTILIEVGRTLKFEMVKVSLVVTMFLLGLVISAVPLVGVALAGVLNIIGNTYLALVDFFDPALSNMKMPVSERFQYVKKHLKGNYGLFFATMVVMFIPLVNILYIPFAVVSSTLFFIEDQKNLPQ